MRLAHKTTSAGLVALGFVASCTPSLGETSSGIRDGHAISTFKTVFAAMAGPQFSTAANARYPRCLASCAHCGDLGLLMTADDNPKAQEIVANAVRPEWKGELGKDGVWIDLRVAWAANKTGDKKITEPGDYEPLQPDNSLDLPSTTVDKNQKPEGDPLDPSPALWLQGIGENADDKGLGDLREGLNFIDYYLQGSRQPTPRVGSFYITHGENACDGDSGGPAIFEDGRYVGVISQGRGKCTETNLTGVTGFDTGAVGQAPSNWAWLDKTIESTCTKKVDVCPGEGGGKVTGSLAPSPLVADGSVMNGAIHCGFGEGEDDCSENVHGPGPRAAQTLTITAVADPGWEFVKWHGDKPCDGSANATCTIPYADVGVYSATESIDTSGYYPEFRWKGGGEPTPTPTPTLTGSSSQAIACARAIPSR